jgi:hypothetical protein
MGVNVDGNGVGISGGGGVCGGSGVDDCEEVFKPVTATSPSPSN